MRISKLQHVYYLLRNNAKNHLLLEDLRKIDGEVVRTGQCVPKPHVGEED